MKVLYIHQYFITPNEPGGTRSYWISREIINRGHKVTMVTSTSKLEPGRYNIDGIDTIYVKNIYNNSLTNLQKICSFLKFIIQSIYIASKEKDVDIVYATSTPLTIGAVALALRALKGWRYIFEVRDLWPEFPIEIGVIKHPFIIWTLRKFEKRIYDKAEHIVALSPGMKEGILNTGVPESKVSMIPNMAKPDRFFPHEKNIKVAKMFNIDLTKFNVIHFGSMGHANGLQYIIEAAKHLQNKGDKHIRFIFMGSGVTETLLKELVIKYELKNVLFLGSHPMDIVSEVVNLCDISITTFLNLPVLKTNSPNKLFDSLSAGKPIIVNSAGWTKDLVEQEHCGFYVDPERPDILAEKLLEYNGNKELLHEWGENARRLSLNCYDKSKLSAQVASLLETVYGKLLK